MVEVEKIFLGVLAHLEIRGRVRKISTAEVGIAVLFEIIMLVRIFKDLALTGRTTLQSQVRHSSPLKSQRLRNRGSS